MNIFFVAFGVSIVIVRYLCLEGAIAGMPFLSGAKSLADHGYYGNSGSSVRCVASRE